MVGWFILLIVLVPLAGALVVLVFPRGRPWIATSCAAVASVNTLLLFPYASATPIAPVHLAGVEVSFVADGMALMLTLIATFIGCLTLVFSADYMQGEANQGRYYALVLVFISAMSGLVLSNSLLLMFIFWEVTALCSYALISFHNDDPLAVAGGLRALIVTQLGGLGLLVGILLLRGALGTDHIDQFLAEAGSLPTSVLTIAAFGFLLAAAAKSAQVPFHIWLPGAMEAPTPISALIHAATMVNAGIYLVARFTPAFAAVPGWLGTVAALGGLSALLGALMALFANDLKRVLAYSTISQLGYMMAALGAGGVFASQFHLLSHAIFKALLFLGAGAVIHAAGTRDLKRLGGLRAQMPFTHAAFLIGALALVGLPGLNGFWSKELIVEASAEGGSGGLAAVLIFTVGLTALYTTRMVWRVFYGPPYSAFHVHDAGPAMRVALGTLLVGTLTNWLLGGPFAQLLAATLPLHALHTPEDLFGGILRAPLTWLALLAAAAGATLWFLRARLGPLARLHGLARWATADFGFDWLSRAVVRSAQQAADALRQTQTGELNWNILQLIIGLVIVLAVAAVGAAA
jgi:NADH-quinone oxidoreductase subunit L